MPLLLGVRIECRGQQIPMGILFEKVRINWQLRGMSATSSGGIGYGK